MYLDANIFQQKSRTLLVGPNNHNDHPSNRIAGTIPVLPKDDTEEDEKDASYKLLSGDKLRGLRLAVKGVGPVFANAFDTRLSSFRACGHLFIACGVSCI